MRGAVSVMTMGTGYAQRGGEQLPRRVSPSGRIEQLVGPSHRRV